MIKSTFELEKKLIKEGYKVVIGIDEAGRGPLAGPVVACAVTLKKCHPELVSGSSGNIQGFFANAQNDNNFRLIKDSKMLSEKQREKLFDFIHKHFFIGIGICDHRTIDRINILEASFLAMKKAFSSLKSKIKSQKSKLQFEKFPLPPAPSPAGKSLPAGRQGRGEGQCTILVDGNKKIPNLSIEQRAIVSGDKIVKSISAASIIAKVTRDRLMRKMHIKYPRYSFDKHKGYGTKLHFEMLEKHGPCEIHRKTFGPVKSLSKR